MPTKKDGRKNNGGHKNAGRKPIKNPKRTGSMRLSDADWAWLDNPANGKSRGEIVSRFIAEKRRITPWLNGIVCILHISATARAWQSPTLEIALRF